MPKDSIILKEQSKAAFVSLYLENTGRYTQSNYARKIKRFPSSKKKKIAIISAGYPLFTQKIPKEEKKTDKSIDVSGYKSNIYEYANFYAVAVNYRTDQKKIIPFTAITMIQYFKKF